MYAPDPIEVLGDHVAEIEELLATRDLEPDPDRKNWVAFGRELDRLEAAAKALAQAVEPAWRAAESNGMRPAIAARASKAMHDAALALGLASRTAISGYLLSSARSVASQGEASEVLGLLRLADSDPGEAARQHYRRWLLEKGRYAQIEMMGGSGSGQAPSSIVRETLVTRAPPLFRINGCGVGLYGHADDRPDGTYLAAYCVSVVFVPLLPLWWYRVSREGNVYHFQAKKPLGLWGRVWQAAFVAGGLGLAVWWTIHAEPRPVAVEQAPATVQQVEQEAGDAGPDELLARYVALAKDRPDDDEGRRAASRAASLLVEQLPAPCTLTSLPAVRRAGAQFRQVPVPARSGAPESDVRGALLRCADQLHGTPLAESEALAAAAAASTDEAQKQALRARRAGVIVPVAEAVVQTDPSYALGLCHPLFPEEAALGVAARAIHAMRDSSALVASVESQIRAWLDAAARTPKLSDEAKDIREQLEQALAQHAEWTKNVSEASDQDFAALVKTGAGREEVSLPLSRMLRDDGKAELAIKALARAGAEGRLTAEARMELASYHRDAGDSAKAEEILLRVVEQSSARYREAAARFEAVHDSAWDDAARQIRRERGIVDDQPLGTEAYGLAQAAVDADPRVKAASTELESAAITIRASIALASVALEQAASEAGTTRDEHLHRAEQVLLDLHAEAAGNSRFDIQLAVVQHRVGKAKEGEAGLRKVLEDANSPVKLQVAKAYRSIGLQARSREVSEQAYTDASDDEQRWEAASFRSVLWTTLEDRKHWLERCDPSRDEVRRDLRDVEGTLALRAGQFDKAEEAYRELLQGDSAKAPTDPVELNNLGLLYESRYEATGDVAYLRTAVRMMSRSAAIQSDMPVVLDNLAVALEHLASVETLERWVHTSALHLSSTAAALAVGDVLLDSGVRDAAVAALRRNHSIGRMLELRKQQLVLAPHDTEPLEARLRWARWLGESARERALLEELPNTPAAETPSGEGRPDAGVVAAPEAFEDGIAPARSRFERAKAEGHAPTIALARVLLLTRLRLANRQGADNERASEMIEHAHQAVKEWPVLEKNDEIVDALLEGALARSLRSSPPLKTAWESNANRRAPMLLLHRVLRAEGSSEACAVLRADAALAEAAGVVRTFGGGGTILGWELARIMGDEAWRRRAAEAARKADYSTLEEFAKREPDGVDADFFRVVQDARADSL